MEKWKKNNINCKLKRKGKTQKIPIYLFINKKKIISTNITQFHLLFFFVIFHTFFKLFFNNFFKFRFV